MSDPAQAAEEQPQELPVATFQPAADANVEELWKGIERSYKVSRDHNRDVLKDHIAASTAAALTFSNQLMHAGLINQPPATEYVEDEETGAVANPQSPGTP
jgi:hypothetical protein